MQPQRNATTKTRRHEEPLGQESLLRAFVPSCLLCCGPLSSSHATFVLNEYSRILLPPKQAPRPRAGLRRRPSNERELWCRPRCSARRTGSSAVAPPVLTRVRVKPGFVTQRSPSIRARTGSRGPQRLFSLNPDHCAAAPPSWRSRETTPQKPCVQRARDTSTSPPDLRDFQDRTGGDHAGRDIPPQRDHELARDRHNANPARALSRPEMLPIPLCQGAVRLPVHPIPRQLNADRLEPVIAGATDPLLPRRLPAVVGRRRKAQESADLASIAERAPHQALVEQHRRACCRHTLQLHQLAQRTRRRRGCHGGSLLAVELRDLSL